MVKITTVKKMNAMSFKQRLNLDGTMIEISCSVILWTSWAARMKTDVVKTRLRPSLSGIIINISVKKYFYKLSFGCSSSPYNNF